GLLLHSSAKAVRSTPASTLSAFDAVIMAPSEERKAELVALFLEVTHSSDEAQGAQMLEWHNWEVQRAVSAFMLGEITPPRSFLMGNNSSGNNNASADS
ncbi:unnamed protein product, partial [Ectocarpus sp. 8 AP-2014]